MTNNRRLVASAFALALALNCSMNAKKVGVVNAQSAHVANSKRDVGIKPPVTTVVAADPRFSKLRSEIIKRVQDGEFPSLSIGILKNGEILWEESIGWSDKKNNTAAAPATPYGLASLGKSVTATAVMVLVQRGKVDLDAPIGRYLGTSIKVFEGDTDQVTVRRVLNMTAGIPHGYATFPAEADMRRYAKDLVKNRAFVVFPPGEVYHYSNFSYAILELMIEKVSGRSYPDFLHTEVFRPLGMTNSFVGPRRAVEGIAPAERYGDDGSLLAPRYALPQNSLAMYASAEAMLNYARFHIGAAQFKGQRIFDDKLLDQMHRRRGEAPHSLMALGFAGGDLADGKLWLISNGRAGGIQATLSMIPSEGLAVVCLINASGQSADDLAFRITDMFSPGFLDHFRHGLSGFQSWAYRPYEPTTELLGEWNGFIATNGNQVPLKLRFQDDGKIKILVAGQPETLLSEVGYREGLLSGGFLANIPMEQQPGKPVPVSISLRMQGNHLSGFITSDFTNETGSFSIAAYVRLAKP